VRITREFVSAFVLLIVVYLVITHTTGAARLVGALGSNLGSLAKTFQGR
jgi:hypothetical protein